MKERYLKSRVWDDKRALQHYKSRLKRVYGLTLEEYQEKNAKQGGRCAICNNVETFVNYKSKSVVNLAVDHDHDTGKVRDLLCRNCNQVLGNVKESTDLLHLMIDYLNRHKT